MSILNCPLCGAFTGHGATCSNCREALGPSRDVLCAALNAATERIFELEERLRWRKWDEEPPPPDDGPVSSIRVWYKDGLVPTHWRPEDPPEAP